MSVWVFLLGFVSTFGCFGCPFGCFRFGLQTLLGASGIRLGVSALFRKHFWVLWVSAWVFLLGFVSTFGCSGYPFGCFRFGLQTLLGASGVRLGVSALFRKHFWVLGVSVWVFLLCFAIILGVRVGGL